MKKIRTEHETIPISTTATSFTLHSWRRPPVSNLGLRWKAALSLLLVLSLSFFGYCLIRPFSRPDFQVLVLGPNRVGQATLAAANDLDLPQILSIANAQSIENALVEKHKTVFVPHEEMSSLTHSLKDLEKTLQASVHPNSTLVVYVSGVLALDKSDPSLCDNSRDAVHAGIAMNLLHLVGRLQQIRCRQILLCIDATIPMSIGPSHVASSIAWKNLGMRLERLLLQDGNTPVAVQLGLNTIDATKCLLDPSPLAKKWSSAFVSGLLWNKTSLHDLQQKLSADNSPDVHGGLASRSMRWMVSADWPLDSHAVMLPSLDSNHAASQVTMAPNSSVSPSPFPSQLSQLPQSSNDSNDIDFELELSTADAPRLIAICDAVLSKWRKARQTNDSLPILLPSPLTRQQTNHFAYHCVLSAYTKLKSTFHLMPSSLDDSQIRLLAHCLTCLDQGRPLPATAPPWLGRLTETYPAPLDKLGSSLVVNATLESLRILNFPSGYPGEVILQELSKQVASGSGGNSAQFNAWLKKLPEGAQNFAEIEWSNWVQSQSDISWELRQQLIEARLLAARLACDPLTAEWSSDLLLEADKSRLQAERALADRSQSDWYTNAGSSIQIAIAKLREGIELVQRVRMRLQKYNDEIIANPLQNSGQGEEAMHALPTAERSVAIADLEHCSKLWFDAIAPWNRTLARQWVDGTALTKSQLAATDCEPEQRIQSVVMFDRFAHAQIESLLQWAATHASEIPLDSSLWIFVKRFWNAKPEQLIDLVSRAKPTMRACVQLNLDRLNRERYGATEKELVAIETQMSWWSEVASSSGYAIVLPPKSTLRFLGDSALDLTARSSLEACIEIESAQNDANPIQLRAEFDSSEADVSIDGKKISSESQLTLPTHNNPKGPLRVSVAVERKQSQWQSKPILLVATRGHEQRRALIKLNAPHEPLVRVDFENLHRSMDSRRARPNDSSLYPNRPNSIAIAITNRNSSTSIYSCRVLLLKSNATEPPLGSLTAEEAIRWIHTVGEPVVAAISKPVLLATGQKQNVSLASLPLPADQPLPIVHTLLLETKNDSTGQIQFQTWTPQVVHPSQYIHPSVFYDASQQTVTVRMKPRSSDELPTPGATVDLEILNHSELQVVSRATVQLHSERMDSQTVLSTSACRSPKALLSITVDRWNPSFVYEIDLNRSGVYETTKQFAALRLQLSDVRDTIVPQNKGVEVQVDAIMNDDCFEEHRDSMEVGFDRNANRSLEDDVTLQLNGTKERSFVWMGTNESGAISIRANVDSHRVKLPVQLEWNRWVPAMATLRRSSNFISSNMVPCVFDRVPPKIETVRIHGRQPALLGLPLSVEVQINDDGLSGVAMVEGGWSTTGEVEFYEQIKIVPAVYRDRDQWLLTVPTDAVPSGVSTLLVRARDRSGNVSKTYPVRVELLRQNEIDAREAAMTTTVRGDVVHLSVPQSGVTVRLIPNLLSEKASETPKGDKEAKALEAVAIVRTDTAGRFVLEKVTRGAYILEFAGIVQGMRVKRTQELIINPINGPLEIHMRLDQKP